VALFITDESERSLGVFVLVSLILHALLIFLYPQWEIAVGPGVLFGGNGGIVTILPIETDQPSPQARVTRQPSEGTADGVKQEVPPKEPTPKEDIEAKVEIEPEASKQEPAPKEEAPTTIVQETQAKPEPEPGEAPLPVEDTQKDVMDTGHDDETLLTSDRGQEVAVGGGGSEEQPMGGTEVDSTARQSTPQSEPAPPPPPPLPAAGSVVAGGGQIAYPKNAINEGAAGQVKLDVYVPKGSTQANRIVVRESSGVQNLDQVARLTIENAWKMEPLLEDYVLSVTVVFTGPPRFDVTILYEGIKYATDIGSN